MTSVADRVRLAALTESDRDWLDRMWTLAENGSPSPFRRPCPVTSGVMTVNEYRGQLRVANHAA